MVAIRFNENSKLPHLLEAHYLVVGGGEVLHADWGYLIDVVASACDRADIHSNLKHRNYTILIRNNWKFQQQKKRNAPNTTAN